jgi:nucleoside-diphosphate kinase
VWVPLCLSACTRTVVDSVEALTVNMEAEKYSFIVDWYDRQADLVRQYTLTYFVTEGSASNEISMFDPKARRNFLKRAPYPDIKLADLIIGQTVTVHARQLTVRGYVDIATKKALEEQRGAICVCTSPNAYNSFGGIITAAYESGLTLTRLRMVDNGGPCVCLELVGNQVEETWSRAAVGSGFENGRDFKVMNVGEGSAFFTDTLRYPSTATFDNCSLCVVRPSAIRAGHAGKIIDAILQGGFEVSAVQMVHFSRAEADELFEVYKGVLPYYAGIIDEMTVAPSIALEVRAVGVCEKLRALAGPLDVELAQHIRPNSLRAKYGVTNATNAVHVTDMEEDGPLESRYVFDILNV